MISAAQALQFANLALNGIRREYPNKLDHIITGARDLQSPRALHPAFYGCFDWHSAVHSHWLLVRLLRVLPQLASAPEIRATLNAHLSAANLLAEKAYLDQPGRQSFERPYGWAWLLKLAEELHTWDDPQGQEWSRNLQPLADSFVALYLDFLPKQTYPIRAGTHANTAFGLAFALDYARAIGQRELESRIVARSNAYFASDVAYPAAWEPGGSDFLSPALVEADLMRRVLAPHQFPAWLQRFLPGLAAGQPANLFSPATVTDSSDPQIVHLHGLNLSRAWCMRDLAAALAPNDPAIPVLNSAATVCAVAALPNIAGDYMGEHWLASFAVYLLT